jgi:tetratricopeptide (TPR) repeat protein
MSGGDATGSTVDCPEAQQGRAALERGACVGRYIIVDQLGSGGMGVVYKAFDPELGRTVALKLLKTEPGGTGGQRDRLLREAQALARLSHPNVIAVHDVGTFQADVFVAMEFVEGQSMREWLKRKPRSQRALLDVFLAAGQGLVAAHRASLVHRDFKPDNVIVGNDGRVRVLDFGLARDANTDAEPEGQQPADAEPPLDATAAARPRPRSTTPSAEEESSTSSSGRDRLLSPLTRAGTIMGTPRFMAPEQCLGEPLDERADQFSFCVTLYFALYDQFPFAGDTPQKYEDNLVYGRIQEPPPGARVPRWLRQVLLRGLSVRPEARWPSMEALLAQLARDPARALRRWLYAGGAALSVAALTVGFVRAQRAERQVCAGAESKLQGIWDAPQREAVRTAFLGTGKPFAEDAFRRVSATLDAYAGEWARMRTSACEATHMRGEQSEELLDLRMECLDQRARELRALTGLFAAADAELVQHSIDAVHALTPLDDCANAVALKTPVRLPSHPGARKRVEALRERMARGQALWEASRDQEGLAWMKSVVEEANTVDHPPTQAQALNLYANFQWHAGELTGAEATSKRALLAAESGKDDEAAARACIRLVRTLVDLRPGSPDAIFFSEHARAWMSRLAGASPYVEVELYAALGALHRERGQLADTMRDYQRELEVAEKAFGRDSALAGKALGDLSIAFYDLGQYEEAIRMGERGLAVDEKALGSHHPGIGETLSNLTQSYNEVGRLDDSVQVLKRADQLLRPMALPGNPWLGVIQVNLGDTYDSQGRYEDALGVLRPALSEQKAPDVVAGLMSGIGSALNHQHKFPEALPLYEKALTLQESAYGSQHPIEASTLYGIGMAHLGLGRPARALVALERAVRLAPVARWLHGNIRLALAQALDANPRSDRARIRALLTEARADLAPVPHMNARELAQIDQWLLRHPD